MQEVLVEVTNRRPVGVSELTVNVTHPPLIYSHVFLAALALLIGPTQFFTRLRTKRISLHRWLGRIYLLSVLFGGLVGLFISVDAFGGVSTKLGFASLAIAWLYTGYRAYAAIRSGDVRSHQRWMIRNFSLTFAGVTLRLFIFAAMALGFSFEVAYPVMIWLWVLNLTAAELLFNRDLYLFRGQTSI
ncbi:MAG: DUF2306 domain-containing protein [Acidobacteriota bacterium]|nr:DUF2306 domain-containing protein [Acidobacteriota bacterium]